MTEFTERWARIEQARKARKAFEVAMSEYQNVAKPTLSEHSAIDLQEVRSDLNRTLKAMGLKSTKEGLTEALAEFQELTGREFDMSEYEPVTSLHCPACGYVVESDGLREESCDIGWQDIDIDTEERRYVLGESNGESETLAYVTVCCDTPVEFPKNYHLQ